MKHITIGILAMLLGANIVGLARKGARGSDDEVFGLDVILSNGEKKTFWMLYNDTHDDADCFSLEDTIKSQN